MDNFIRDFKERIRRKEIRLAVVGLGYVGLPLAVEFVKKGFYVLGIDIDKDRLSRIRERESYITDITTEELRRALDTRRLCAAGDFSALRTVDVIIICVPTPLKRKYHPDISYIKQAVRSISRNMKKQALIILESTTYPGTTEDVILPLLEAKGWKCGRDFYLAFSPERIDPGNVKYPVNRIPKVIGGVTKEATELARSVYKNIIDKIVPVSSARVAEAVKLLENTFRLINIALIDELAMMGHKMNIDIWEVIDAAKTKPFGFMPFYPGPGVGGHCLDRNETVFVKNGSSLSAMKMPDFIKHIENAKDNNIKVLSFDPFKGRSVFKEVTAASARPYSGRMVDIATEDGRHLKVTDMHPMFVYDGSLWQLKYAKDLRRGDSLPICLELPPFTNSRSSVPDKIDIASQIQQKGRYLIDKVRVRPVDFMWKEYAKELKSVLRKDFEKRLPDSCWDYLSDNILPLKYFYALEKLVRIDHNSIKLVTGRGPGYSEMPAIITLDEDFCRLIGYYLSEGCYTKDKSVRIRFSFNRSEKEYVQDAIDILYRLGIRTSIYESKVWQSSCIKVSSNIFGFLIDEILGCGRNCYNMSIPERIFGLDTNRKKALLSGVFRGDACVEHFFGKWRYRKNQKEYLHNVNTANISFFTSSQKLFQQIIILLHDLGVIPTFKKRKYSLSIFGYEQLKSLGDIFEGKKKEILAKYLKLNKNRPINKTFQRQGSFATVKVKDISFAEADMVYSLETTRPHSFITSYGIAVHNCIPKDPLYLYWKARHFGFRSRFIKLASDIISYMPEYVVTRLEDILKERNIGIRKARILVVGVTYKKDIKDLRKSPSLDMIISLQNKGAEVSYFDPLIPYLRLNHAINLRSIILKKDELDRFDCVVIAADHSAIDYGFILKNSRLIFDSRNVYKDANDDRIFRL